MTEDVGLAYLLARAGLVEDRVRRLVAARRADDPSPDDPFRGLYLSDETVDRILATAAEEGVPADQDAEQRAALEHEVLTVERSGAVVSLRRLAVGAGLSALDVELLVIALLPDLDTRFERLYGYLNDDVTRRRASVGLALTLAGLSPMAASGRSRLEPSRPLLAQGLITIEDPDRPLLSRGLRVPDRVVAHLLGDDAPDAALAGVLEVVRPYASAGLAHLAHILTGPALVYLRESVPGSAAPMAAAALAEAGRGHLALDLTRLANGAESGELLAAALREVLLTGAGVIAGPTEALPDGLAGRLSREAASPVILVGASTWDPRWADRTPLCLEAPALSVTERVALWRRELGGEPDHALATVGHLALGPAQVLRAAEAARASARVRGEEVGRVDVQRGVRAQNAAGLERLARRIEPEVSWSDLVLTPPVLRALRDVTARARHRDRVLSDWRMRRGGGRGHGVTALFAGDSGTGKTMSAEVIAADLGLDLYTVNLASVVDKYIGETEKNLERIFVEAAGVNAVLFFDEADAIFGKRSDVRDAHDRYANIESAYLLQRLETFDGLAVLATNLRANIDEAFTRRLDAIIDFPAPTQELRRSLWAVCLAPPLPADPDLDLDFLAASFELAGGNIRSAATTAAYLAAADGVVVGMAQLITAVEQEYRKLGRLVLEREFGRYFGMIA